MILSRVLLIGACAGMIGACSMREPGNVTLSKARVSSEKIYDEVMLSQADEGYFKALGNHYRKSGDGPVDVTVVYDPKSKTSTAMKANRDAARIVSNLNGEGVRDVRTNILPVMGHGDESEILISYQAYTAQAPEKCTTMPGYKNNELNITEEYETGCTIETLLAKQIARPKDMAGQEADSTSDGRRAAVIVDGYRAGEPNDALEGLTTTGD